MATLSYILAVLIILIRVSIPISESIMGQWPARLVLFILWYMTILAAGGNTLNQFYLRLKTRVMEMACYAVWIMILALYYLIQRGEHIFTGYILNAYIGTIPFYFIGTYFSATSVIGGKMALSMGVVIGACCLYAIPTVWQNPEYVRMSAINSIAEIKSMGIGTYGELTGIAIILPFLITVALQHKHLARVLGVGSCLAIIAFMMVSTFSGLILLSALSVVGCYLFYAVIGGFGWKKIIALITVTVVILTTVACVFPSIYESSAIGRFYDKLANTFLLLPGIVAGKEDDPTLRYTLMLDSLRVFLGYPIFGAAPYAVGIGTAGAGGHSSFVDALANYGLFGGIPYLLFHLLVLRRLWHSWRGDRQNALYFGCLLSCANYFLYSIFNITSQGTTVALFLFVIAACSQESKVPMIYHQRIGLPNRKLRNKMPNYSL